MSVSRKDWRARSGRCLRPRTANASKTAARCVSSSPATYWFSCASVVRSSRRSFALLKSEHVPVAGADRLNLADHIAVHDLVALGRAALLPQDDLTLASVLKSPFFGFDDDDLIALAPGRRASLIEALEQSEDARCREAAARLRRLRRDAAAMAPFDFYSSVLGPDGGRAQLMARLGGEAEDAIDEFLKLAASFEREQPPSLTAFLAMAESLDLSIKRDMELAGGAVRVMTAHAAKGLEAKIVFLPDTCGASAGKHDPKLYALGEADDAVLLWSIGKDSDPIALQQAREAHRRARARGKPAPALCRADARGGAALHLRRSWRERAR